MVIKIIGSIIDDESKQFDLNFFGIDSNVSFKSIDEALEAKAEDDKEIVLKINCNGGSCIEGYAIYDKLRAQEGCTITAEVEGECSSMATIILLAASVRRATKNARVCIHKPRICYFFRDEITEDEALKVYNDLKSETDRMMSIYVERTGSTRETLEPLMKEDKYITVEEAQTLGFINEIIEPVTAIKSNQFNNKNHKSMKENKKEPGAIANAFKVIGEALGFTGDKKDDQPVAMTLNTDDGQTIEIERESGEPEVGDPASPDGEFKMPDGKTIIIADGVITEIKPAEPDNNDDPDPKDAEIQRLKDENDDLKKQLDEAKGQKKTKEEAEILNMVTIAGGKSWLERACSNYHPEGRTGTSKNVQTVVKSKVQQELEELQAKRKGQK